MRRDPQQLAAAPFEILVVGAGIQGTTIAWAAARRGLRVALVDAADFGAGASANSLKIIHGGLRYLQHGDLPRMRESIRARRRLMFLAPETVRPLACIMPTRGIGGRGRGALAIALALNAVISADRNRGLRAGHTLPAGRIISPSEMTSLVPGAKFPGATGGAVWHDAIADDIDRLNLSFVQSAAGSGAVAANHVRAIRLLEESGRVTGAEVRDEITGAHIKIRAAQVICAAGPGNAALRPGGPRIPWVKAANLILRKPLVGDAAIAIEGTEKYEDTQALIKRGRRNFFVVPWRGGTMIGTLYKPHDPATGSCALTAGEIDEFIRQVNETAALPPITHSDISRIHAGTLPADSSGDKPSKQTIIARPAPGLITVQAVKYTTAVETADHLIDSLTPRTKRPTDAPLPWTAPPARLDDLVAQAVDHEMAMTLGDLIMRRTTLGALGLPDPATLQSCAQLMAARLGWDDRRKTDELAALIREHRVPSA